MYNATECIMAIQGHPRTLTLITIKSTHVTSY